MRFLGLSLAILVPHFPSLSSPGWAWGGGEKGEKPELEKAHMVSRDRPYGDVGDEVLWGPSAETVEQALTQSFLYFHFELLGQGLNQNAGLPALSPPLHISVTAEAAVYLSQGHGDLFLWAMI